MFNALCLLFFKFKLFNIYNIDEIKQELEVAVKHVKHAYNQCPNYQVVVEAIIEDGIENLDKRCKLKPGIPLKPMLANPTKGIHEILKRFENITFTCEYKYDGERAQIHILEDGSCQVFSRNSENNTSKYPDMIQSLQEILNLKTSKKKAVEEEDKPSESAENKKIVTSAILDAEVVAYDLEKKVILPFQVLSTRKRKDANVNEIKVQVCIFAFDLIMLNGQSLIGESFRKRREYLYDYFPYVEAKLMYAVNMNSNDVEKIQEFLDQSIKGNFI
jgi:DNA ligase-1